jgi:hypothetical protein
MNFMSLDKCSGMELMGWKFISLFIFLFPKWFSDWLHMLNSHEEYVNYSVSRHPFLAFSGHCYFWCVFALFCFNFSLLVDVKQELSLLLSYVSLMVNDVSFVYLPIVHLLWVYVPMSVAHFLIGIFSLFTVETLEILTYSRYCPAARYAVCA